MLQREYQEFYGKLTRNPDAERLFEAAAREVAAGRRAAAIELLRSAVKEAPVPVVFNDLAVLLADSQEHDKAAAAFREALARDPDSQLVGQNLARLGFSVEMGRPVVQEEEPNNSPVNSNFIPLGKDIQAEIAEGTGDIDCLRFVAPPAPRDHVAIEIVPRSPILELGMRMYDENEGLALDHRPEPPGEKVTEYIAPRPNTTWYLEIAAAHGTSGDYTVRVAPMHAFDQYEPNDNIFAAARVETGTPIQANIMDVEDTDFYAFESPASGTVTVTLENRSSTLIPALTTFGPDKRNMGFGPDIRNPGASFRHTMTVEAHRTYYLQVWSQARTSGAYTLTIE